MKKLLLSVLASTVLLLGVKAQTNIANYTFAKSMGTYVPLGTSTVLGTASAVSGATTSLDGTNYRVAFPGGFTFTYGGVAQTDININSNGYIGFGTAIWTGNTTSPLANNPVGGTTNGIISAFALDLNAVFNPTASVIGDISYELIGTAPDRELVVQFKNFKPYSGVVDARLVNFQIHLFEATHTTAPNSIQMIYGASNIGNSTATALKVGIRGSTLTYSNNCNSLMIGDVPAGTSCDWFNPVTAFSNTSNLIFTTTNTLVSIPNGLIYTWAPPAVALAPVRTFTNVTGITANSATVSWTAPTGATQYNVQYRIPGACAWTSFAGNPVLTNTVVLTGLSAATVYQVRVQSSDGTNNSIYSHIPDIAGTGNGYTTAGTFSTVTTCTVPTALNTSTILATSANFTWTAGGTETAWDIYYGTQPLAVPNATTVPTATSSVASYSVTGLTQLTPYSVYVRANCGPGDLSLWTAVKNFTTIAACPLPLNVTMSAITPTSAVATWTAGGAETSWLVSYTAPTTTAIVSGSPSYTLNGLTPSSTYSIQVKGICAVGDSSSFTTIKTFITPCLPPNITGTTPNVRCGVGTTTLGATADVGASINWYSAPTGGMPIGTGSVFTTPTLTGTTNFYVTAIGSPISGSGGRTAPTATANTTPSTYGLVFDATQPFILNSVDVYPTAAAGTLSVNLTDNTGAVLQTATVALATGTVGVPQTVSLNFPVPVGTGYRLLAISGPSMIRESSLGGFPYAIGSVGNITSGYIGGTSTTYYYFYNWQFSAGCESARTAVTASVTLPDAVVASTSSSTLCVGATSTTTLVATQTGTTNAYSFTWDASPVAGSGMPSSVSGSVAVVTPTLPGIYTYSVTATDGVCTTISSVSVALNNVPTPLALATPSAVCFGGTTTLTLSTPTPTNMFLGNTSGTAINTTGTPYRTGTVVGNETRTQYLILASELSAAGFLPGNINSLGFIVSTAAPTGVMTNFSIDMAHTSMNALTATYLTPAFTNVYSIASYAPVNGSNIHNFSTPFNWDGVSNIVINVCGTLGTSGSGTTLITSTTPGGIIATIANSTATGCTDATGTTIANRRPRFIISGNTNSNMTNISWSDGSIVGTTNPLTQTITANTTYSVTADVNGCPVATSVSVISLALPSVPVVSDNTQCGIGVPTASVSGGTSYNWYATPTSTTVLQAGASANYTTSISSTTTWYVSSFNGTCESPRVAVTQTVTTPPALTLNTPAAICAGTVGTFSVTSNVSDYTSYVWSPLAKLYTDAAGTIAYTGNNTPQVYVKSNVDGVITVSVNATSTISGCSNITTTTIQINPTPNAIVVTPSSATICAGNSQTITATGGNAIPTLTLGTNVTQNTATTYPAAYSAYYGGQRMQTLILASELSAAGFINGSAINRLEMPVVSLGANWGTTITSLQNFQINMKATTSTSLSAFQTGLTNVVPAGTYTPVVGNNVHVFATPFIWDGVSNVVLETTFSNNFAGVSADAVIQYNTGTSFQSTILYRADNVTAAATSSATTISSSFSARPDLRLNQKLISAYTWNPSSSLSTGTGTNVVATPSASTVYTVTATFGACSSQGIANITVNANPTVTAVSSSSTICSGTSATLTASGATNYTWSPVGGTASIAVVTPTTSSVYTVTGSASGCSSTATVSLTVNQTPTVTASASSTVICSGGANTVTLTANSTTPDYSWTPSGGTAATEVVSPGANTVYTVTSTNAGCIGTATVGVNVNTTPTLTLASTTASMCSGGTATLTAAGATNYTWSPSGDLTATSVVTPSATTIYSVTGETLGCATTSTINLDVTSTPTVSAVSNPSVICSGSSATLIAVSSTPDYTWSPAGGTADVAIVSPSSNTTYTVTSTNGACVGTATVDLYVLTVPVLTVSPTNATACSGATVAFTAMGADTYTWSSGGGNAATAVYTPTAMATYTVDGSNVCGNGTATVSVGVDSPLTLNASTSATMICMSIESATLTVTGTATNFTWSPGGQTTASVVVTPTTTTVYTVTASNACGVVTSTVTQNVQDCTGIEELFAAGMNVYPNPATDVVNFSIPSHLVGQVKLEIYDAIGKLVALEELTKELTSLKVTKLEDGVYIFKMITNNGDVKIGRLIKQ